MRHRSVHSKYLMEEELKNKKKKEKKGDFRLGLSVDYRPEPSSVKCGRRTILFGSRNAMHNACQSPLERHRDTVCWHICCMRGSSQISLIKMDFQKVDPICS